MNPKILFVAISVLAGLALVPAAWGNHQYGDAFDSSGADPREHAVAARNTTGSSLIFDNHRLAQPTNADRRLVGDNYRDVPKPVSRPPIVASDSGRDIEWPQIGMGFGLGILLALGLFLAMRYTRIRPLAH